MALLQDFQRAQKLAAKVGMLEARLRQRRQRAYDVPTVLGVAERGLDPPDADDDRGIDAEFCLHGPQCVSPLRKLARAGVDAVFRHHAVDVSAEWLAVFGL